MSDDLHDQIDQLKAEIEELNEENKRLGSLAMVNVAVKEIERRDELLRKCEKFIDGFIDATNAGEDFYCGKIIDEILADPLWKEILGQDKNPKARALRD